MVSEFRPRMWHSLSMLGLFGILFNHFLISAKLTPRGVPLSRAALYDPQKEFVCLDGSKSISFSFVNDDYCDCPDGSDEPGTSACSNGRFFCVNAGHASTYIQSSRVNDGLCDCCDGSDEFDGGVGCPDTCDEMGRVAREEAERSIQLARDGYQKRQEMSAQGKSTRQAKEEEKSKLESERLQAEALKDEKQNLKDVAEAPEKLALEEYRKVEDEKKQREDSEEKERNEKEALDIFNLIDSNADEKITVAEIQARATFDRNKDGVVSDEEASFFLNLEQEISKEEWFKSGWLIAKPYFLMERGMFTPPDAGDHAAEDSAQNEGDKEEATDDTPEEHDFEDDEAEDAGEIDHAEDEKPTSEEDTDYSTDNTKDTDESQNAKYDSETMELIRAADKARSEFQEADTALREISRKLEELNEVLNLDFGEDERFSPLHGLCFDYEDREYVYTLCPFKDANQRGKNGGSVVNLGKWGSWSGSDENKFSQMLYDRGQSCWNGPARSARVFIQCGVENRVIAVTEPSRCEYQFDFTSPSACQNPETLMHSHDEL